MKVYISIVSYNTSDEKGFDIIGVYRNVSDAKENALQEVKLWQDNFTCNDSIILDTDNETWWCFDDRMSNYVEISIIQKDCL